MTLSSVNLLREWSSSIPSSEKEAGNPEDAPPVIATLVAKGNVLFQNAYGQFGQHFSFGNTDNQLIQSIPSNSFDLEIKPSYNSWVCDDCPDQGELQIIENEALEVYPVDDFDDEQYEQAFHNRRKPPRKPRCNSDNPVTRLRNIFKGKGREKKTVVVRGRKGSRDKKNKKQNATSPTAMFPVQIQDETNTTKKWTRKNRVNDRGQADFEIPLATPCLSLKKKLDPKSTTSNAPRKQNMSRAAIDIMKEPKIIPDSEISELNSDPDESLSIHHSYTDTEAYHPKTPPRSCLRSNHVDRDTGDTIDPKSWDNFLEETRSVLDGNIQDRQVIKTENETTPTRAIIRLITSYTQSFPNDLSSSLPPTHKKQSKIESIENRKIDYTPQLQQRAILSQLQVPESPRKLHRELHQDSIKSPPRCMFKKSNEIQQSPNCISYDTAQDRYNNKLKVVFLGSPNSGKSSIVSAITNKTKINKENKKCNDQRFQKTVDVNMDTWDPIGLNDDRRIIFNLWDIKGGSLDIGAHHVSKSIDFMSISSFSPFDCCISP